jgi:hypothetical protein
MDKIRKPSDSVAHERQNPLESTNISIGYQISPYQDLEFKNNAICEWIAQKGKYLTNLKFCAIFDDLLLRNCTHTYPDADRGCVKVRRRVSPPSLEERETGVPRVILPNPFQWILKVTYESSPGVVSFYSKIAGLMVANICRTRMRSTMFTVHCCLKRKLFMCLWKNTVTCISDYRRGSDWWMDLLTTYTHCWGLQEITAPPLISTIHKSPQHQLSLFPAWFFFISRYLATASTSGDSSASRTKVISSHPPLQKSTQLIAPGV